jgi:uncharacterized protein YjbI with pentapeptide repeats
MRPIRWWVVLTCGAVVIGAGTTALAVLLHVAGQAKGVDLQAQLRLDAIKAGLSVAAGTGGAAALLLAVRRQWLQERTQGHTETVDAARQEYDRRVAESTEHDALERRITDLYIKAVEQLGSAKAPVRLGGLYALARLGQTNLDQRQTIIDVICAYLRMPYTPPGQTTSATLPERSPQDQDPATRSHPDGEADRREELQVRVTAQTLLLRHCSLDADDDSVTAGQLQPDPTRRFWPGMRLDLTGATLINFDFTRARLTTARFDESTFTGNACFGQATFTGDASFADATFTNELTSFESATFTGIANFDHTTFTGDVNFYNATFAGDDAYFGHATFARDAYFRHAAFARTPNLGHVTFNGRAIFDGAGLGGEPFSGAASGVSEPAPNLEP